MRTEVTIPEGAAQPGGFGRGRPRTAPRVHLCGSATPHPPRGPAGLPGCKMGAGCTVARAVPPCAGAMCAPGRPGATIPVGARSHGAPIRLGSLPGFKPSTGPVTSLSFPQRL